MIKWRCVKNQRKREVVWVNDTLHFHIREVVCWLCEMSKMLTVRQANLSVWTQGGHVMPAEAIHLLVGCGNERMVQFQWGSGCAHVKLTSPKSVETLTPCDNVELWTSQNGNSLSSFPPHHQLVSLSKSSSSPVSVCFSSSSMFPILTALFVCSSLVQFGLANKFSQLWLWTSVTLVSSWPWVMHPNIVFLC